jgi:hypothetical protein
MLTLDSSLRFREAEWPCKRLQGFKEVAWGADLGERDRA